MLPRENTSYMKIFHLYGDKCNGYLRTPFQECHLVTLVTKTRWRTVYNGTNYLRDAESYRTFFSLVVWLLVLLKSGTPHLKEKKSSNTKLRCKTNGDYSSNLPIFATEFNENIEIWWWMWKDLMKNFHLFYTWVFVLDWLDSVVRRIGNISVI